MQIVLLVLGVIAAFRMPRLLRLKSADFPGVAPEDFANWHRAEKKAAWWFVIATIGVFLIQLVVGFSAGVYAGLTHASQEEFKRLENYVNIGGLALFLPLIVVAAAFGSRCVKLKEKAGISWPKKSK